MTTAQDSNTGVLVVAGLGPGAIDLMAPRARLALEQAEIVVGYRTYLDLVRDCLNPQSEVISSSMMQEIDRCRKALELAAAGKRVVLVCGGDPGIYAMAGLVFELAKSMDSQVEIDIIPGIAALNSCAAILGAPLMHDFAAISLSDLMTPWAMIERRLEAVAPADFVVVIYNPKSKKRTDQIVRAREILLAHRSPDIPVGIVSGATREHETVRLTTLGTMLDQEITGDRHDIEWPLTQRRDGHREDIETVKKILAKNAFGDSLGHIAVGGGDDADIERHRLLAANPLDLALLQDAEQLGLEAHRHFSDLIEKQRTLLRLLELAGLRLLRPGKGALFVTEQGRFEQTVRDRRAVDGDEGTIPPGRLAMDEASHHFLADA